MFVIVLASLIVLNLVLEDDIQWKLTLLCLIDFTLLFSQDLHETLPTKSLIFSAWTMMNKKSRTMVRTMVVGKDNDVERESTHEGERNCEQERKRKSERETQGEGET